MAHYYFVGSALPELRIDAPPEMGFQEFETLLYENLKPSDLADFKLLRLYYDIQNIRAFWKKEPFDHLGTYNENELEEALVVGEGFPDYVLDFLRVHEKIEDRLAHFPKLVSAFFREEERHSKGFIQKFLCFEREWRLVLAAFRAKKRGQDLIQVFQYEDPSDNLVAQFLAQKDSSAFETPEGYEELKQLFEEHYDSPLALYQALAEYRFQKIESFWGTDVFSIDRIYAYFVQLVLVEKWQALDRQKGIQTVDTLVKDAS
ncbi:DUF2764 family protein [Parachlamydia sp. AcF125]|uniref:DUF2764 family protein n=1 Tax=Parachlamydia sp. AcF125 TaxID=2795736 RepID=UPI001BC97478|nr:DUF2764 family protein [Parachlamydia sp. AcF125]MBS4167479.1 hypothetical protein [Parachlamydia sp. AcF125]